MTWAQLKENQKLRFFKYPNTIRMATAKFQKIEILEEEKMVGISLEKKNFKGQLKISSDSFAFNKTYSLGFYALEDAETLKKNIGEVREQRKEKVKVLLKEVKEQMYLIELLNIDLGLKLKRW